MPHQIRPYIRDARAIAAIEQLMEIEGSDLNDVVRRAVIQYCEQMAKFYQQQGIGQSPPPLLREVRSPSPTPLPSNGSTANPKELLEQVTKMSSDSFG